MDRHADREERPERAAEPTVAAPVAPAPVRLAARLGNRAFGQLLGRREGDGLLPSGAVHPDVETTLERTRGTGRSLDPGVRDRVGPSLGDPLADVTVHTDATADALTRSVSARAFATGRDLYFAAEEYRPGTRGGDELLAHELTHVVQQRGAPTSGPLTVTQPDDGLEREADAVARELSA